MKAFLLAAGLGTRLRPLTETVPKCLLPIQGTPLLAVWLELCARAGIDEVLINVHAHADTVRKFLIAHEFAVSVETAQEPQLLGSAGTVAANRGWVEGEDEFFILYGDVLTNADLRTIQAHHRRACKIATLGLNRVPDPSRCGVVTVDQGGTIIAFQEKPSRPASNLVFSGMMVAGPEFLNYLPQQTPADLGFDVLPRLGGRMAGCEITSYLTDIGTMPTYLNAQHTWPGLTQGQRC